LTEKHKRLDWHGPKSINTWQYMTGIVWSFLMRPKLTFEALMVTNVIGKENAIVYSLTISTLLWSMEAVVSCHETTVAGIIVRMFCNFIRFALYLCSQIR
jgi:hypothetical protein